MIDPADVLGPHIDRASPNQTPGVGPAERDPRGHFQLCGEDARVLVVVDLGNVISIGGINVSNPDHLEEAAVRLTHLADALRRRQNTPRPLVHAGPCWSTCDRPEHQTGDGSTP